MVNYKTYAREFIELTILKKGSTRDLRCFLKKNIILNITFVVC